MSAFGIDITLMQGVIVEQQITNFILENEYKKELGVVTEAEDSKLKAAGEWIGKQVDRFIGLLKTWWGKIVHFVTKTIPKYVSTALNWLRSIFHLRQKPEKVDVTKIDDSNKEKVKEACNQANAATIKEKSINDKKEVQQSKAELNNFSKALGHKEKQDNKNDNNLSIEEKIEIEKINAYKQQAINKLNNIKENSDKPEEKAEIEKAVNNIEQGKTVELSSENSDYLEGNIVKLELIQEFINFWVRHANTLDEYFDKIWSNGYTLRNKDEYSQYNIKYINRGVKKEYEDDDEYLSYTKEKENKKMSIKAIIKSKEKIKIKKTVIESNFKKLESYQKDSLKYISKEKKHIEKMISIFNNYKKDKEINQKALYSYINKCNFYMKDVTLMQQDMSELYQLTVTELGSFISTAKPCSSN